MHFNKQDHDRIKKVAIVGPESTGKSELAELLATHYKTSWVPEYAREYLDSLSRAYNQHDLTLIAAGQLKLEESKLKEANKVLFCDTTLLVIKVWSEFKYESCDPAVLEAFMESSYDLHLLTYIDIPWQNDPYREHPHKRAELYEIYLREIKTMNVPFVEIRGKRSERRRTAIEAVDRLLNT